MLTPLLSNRELLSLCQTLEEHASSLVFPELISEVRRGAREAPDGQPRRRALMGLWRAVVATAQFRGECPIHRTKLVDRDDGEIVRCPEDGCPVLVDKSRSLDPGYEDGFWLWR